MHAPQSAMPQPNFVPVSPSVSRITQRSGMFGSTSTLFSAPLTVRLTLVIGAPDGAPLERLALPYDVPVPVAPQRVKL